MRLALPKQLVRGVALPLAVSWSACCGGGGVELSYCDPDSLVTRCPGQAVASILDNLVGNAIRYGRIGGQVEVRLVQQEGGFAVKWVAPQSQKPGRGADEVRWVLLWQA